MSTRDRGPKWSGPSPSHRWRASATRVGSVRLCTWSTTAAALRSPAPYPSPWPSSGPASRPSSGPPSKSLCAGRSRRSESRTPASIPAATSAAHSRAPGSDCGAPDANGAPATSAAAGVRGRVSATASTKSRSNPIGSGSRSGRLSATGTAYASPGMAAAMARRCTMSAGSRGPARQASMSSAVRPGSSLPRAARCRACSVAAPQQAAAGCAPGSCRAPASSGTASASGSSTAGTARPRAPLPCRRATVSSVGSPAGPPSPAGSEPPSGRQRAIFPARGGRAGRKVTAQLPNTAPAPPTPPPAVSHRLTVPSFRPAA